MKCQRCAKPATLHITEVLTEEQFSEFHLCEDCAQNYLSDVPIKGAKLIEAPQEVEEASAGRPTCPICGLKFVEFRNSGRLGCPHDYSEFREELMPLLENIHGETRHVGKTPRRLPQTRQTHGELVQLRKQLHQAVTKEAYEEAARLRDRIRQLESN